MMDAKAVRARLRTLRNFVGTVNTYFSPGYRQATLNLIDQLEEMALESLEGGDPYLSQAKADFEAALTVVDPRPNDSQKKKLMKKMTAFTRELARVVYRAQGYDVEGPWADTLKEVGAGEKETVLSIGGIPVEELEGGGESE